MPTIFLNVYTRKQTPIDTNTIEMRWKRNCFQKSLKNSKKNADNYDDSVKEKGQFTCKAYAINHERWKIPSFRPIM
jgi:hypothetical protein